MIKLSIYFIAVGNSCKNDRYNYLMKFVYFSVGRYYIMIIKIIVSAFTSNNHSIFQQLDLCDFSSQRLY